MEGYRPETYGDRVADIYDAMTAGMPDPADCVDRLAELAGPGPALELGIGTGRVALPLAARGVPVYGIDASAAMVGGCGPNRAATRSRSPSATSPACPCRAPTGSSMWCSTPSSPC